MRKINLQESERSNKRGDETNYVWNRPLGRPRLILEDILKKDVILIGGSLNWEKDKWT